MSNANGNAIHMYHLISLIMGNKINKIVKYYAKYPIMLNTTYWRICRCGKACRHRIYDSIFGNIVNDFWARITYDTFVVMFQIGLIKPSDASLFYSYLRLSYSEERIRMAQKILHLFDPIAIRNYVDDHGATIIHALFYSGVNIHKINSDLFADLIRIGVNPTLYSKYMRDIYQSDIAGDKNFATIYHHLKNFVF